MHELFHQVQARVYGEEEFLSKWRDQRDEFKDAGKPFEELYYTPGKLEFEAETFKNLIDGRLFGP